MNFREFKPHDLPKIAEIEALSYPDQIKFSEEKIMEVLADPDVFAFVVENEEGKAAGFAILKLKKISNHLRVLSLAVNPENRGRGIGTELVKKVIAMAKFLRLTDVYVQFHEEALEHKSLFSHAGFSLVGPLPDYPVKGKNGEEWKLALPL